jgi:formamidopyrimidine-DNA glycosylase
LGIVLPNMPELPEVETVRRGLSDRILGESVVSVALGQASILEGCDADDLAGIPGGRFAAVDRKGKYLLLRLEGRSARSTLVVHLGMTGQLTWRADGETVTDRFRRLVSGYRKSVGPHSIDAHTHLVVGCSSGGELLFRDPRRFGRILLFAGWEDKNCPRLERLGPDAWRIDPERLAARLKERAGRRAVKAVLLDQGVAAGIGNIYADEACFHAGILPGKVLSGLSARRIAELALAVGHVLDKGVRNAGTSFRDFVGADGAEGSNQEDLRVYGRGGEACTVCGRTLRTAVVAQRTTVWCPKCQT